MEPITSTPIWHESQIENVDTCTMCGSSDLSHLIERPDGLTLVHCNTCHFSFLGKRPIQSALAAYYNSDYFQDSATYQDYFNYAKASNDLGYCPRLHRLQPFINNWNGLRVIEIGCAAGSTLNLIQRYGGLVEGIEISDEAAGIARNLFNLNIFNGPFEESPIKKNNYDVVLMFDVLEHLPSAGNTIDQISKILSPKGYFAMTVPNFDRFALEKSDWPGLHSWFEHLNYFTSDVLSKRLEKSGFTIIEKHTYTAGLHASGRPENKQMRTARNKLKKMLHLPDYPLRVARKIKFIIKGPPYLDKRYDQSGMDLFILAQKTS